MEKSGKSISNLKLFSMKRNIPIQIKGTVQDITERKQMEKELESICTSASGKPQSSDTPGQRPYHKTMPTQLLKFVDMIGVVLSIKKAPQTITDMAIAALDDGIQS